MPVYRPIVYRISHVLLTPLPCRRRVSVDIREREFPGRIHRAHFIRVNASRPGAVNRCRVFVRNYLLLRVWRTTRRNWTDSCVSRDDHSDAFLCCRFIEWIRYPPVFTRVNLYRGFTVFRKDANNLASSYGSGNWFSSFQKGERRARRTVQKDVVSVLPVFHFHRTTEVRAKRFEQTQHDNRYCIEPG